MRATLLLAAVLLAATATAEDAAESDVTGVTSHVELDTTTIKANRELPSVMAVVPWKKALPAGLGGRPDKSLVEALLKPLDPDVFRLQLDFYEQLFVANESASDDADGTKRESK